MGCGVSSTNSGEGRRETAVGPTAVAPVAPAQGGGRPDDDDASSYGGMEHPLPGGGDAVRVERLPATAPAAPVAGEPQDPDAAVRDWIGSLSDPSGMVQLPSDRASSTASSTPSAAALAAYDTLSLHSGVSQTHSVASSLAMHVGQAGELSSQTSFSDRMASIASQEPASYHHVPGMLPRTVPGLVVEESESSDSSGAAAGPVGHLPTQPGDRGLHAPSNNMELLGTPETGYNGPSSSFEAELQELERNAS